MTKKVKCPECYDKREVPEDTTMPICGACQVKMIRTNCPDCFNKLIFTKTHNSVHYGRLDCPKCDKWVKWVSNPKDESRKKTSNFEKEDVFKFHNMEKNCCFFCLRTKEQLGKNETLTIDHIEELNGRGKDEIQNLQILCTACHKLKNWMRLYNNWHFREE